jgi:hypothetical protein
MAVAVSLTFFEGGCTFLTDNCVFGARFFMLTKTNDFFYIVTNRRLRVVKTEKECPI